MAKKDTNKTPTSKKRKPAPRITTAKRKELFLEAMLKTRGNISASAKAAGVSRTTYYDWVSDDDKFFQDIEDANEAIIDMVEQKLIDMMDFNPTAAIFWLKQKAKERGYAEETNININQTPQSIIFTPFQEIKPIDETDETKGLTE